MSAFTIRGFRPEDGEALADLHRRAILATPTRHYTEAERESWAAGLVADGYAKTVGEHIEVAVHGADAAVAFCSQNGENILAVYVAPEWQRTGIGSELMGRAEARITASGHAVARVHAATSAVPFYQRHGYRIVEQTSHKTRGGLVLRSTRLEKALG